MKKITLIYLAFYLFVGGLGFASIPETILKLFMSNGAYGDIMPRVAGMFMLVLGFLITLFIKNKDYKYYFPTIIARSFIVIFLTVLYFNTDDPLFIILNCVVLIGLLPSIYIYIKGRS